MPPKPKSVDKQTVVITGASSGIGRQTALLLAQRGANVVLAARSLEALEATARQVRELGGKALVVECDVSSFEDVKRVAGATMESFGAIDTWVNNAGISEYSLIDDQSVTEIERIMRVNFMGMVHGCKAALPFMKNQVVGTIINVGSVLSLRSIPLQGAYCASKHAVKGFTESLRMEMVHSKIPVYVTLILPSVINTPFYTTAKSRMGVRPKPMPPIYDARVVAEAIVFACENPRRDIVAGGFGKMLGVMESVSAPLTDWYMTQNDRFFNNQKEDEPDDGRSTLYAPAPGEGQVSGGYRRSIAVSPYTRYVEQHPNVKRGLAAALLGGAALLAASKRRKTGA